MSKKFINDSIYPEDRDRDRANGEDNNTHSHSLFDLNNPFTKEDRYNLCTCEDDFALMDLIDNIIKTRGAGSRSYVETKRDESISEIQSHVKSLEARKEQILSPIDILETSLSNLISFNETSFNIEQITDKESYNAYLQQRVLINLSRLILSNSSNSVRRINDDIQSNISRIHLLSNNYSSNQLDILYSYVYSNSK